MMGRVCSAARVGTEQALGDELVVLAVEGQQVVQAQRPRLGRARRVLSSRRRPGSSSLREPGRTTSGRGRCSRPDFWRFTSERSTHTSAPPTAALDLGRQQPLQGRRDGGDERGSCSPPTPLAQVVGQVRAPGAAWPRGYACAGGGVGGGQAATTSIRPMLTVTSGRVRRPSSPAAGVAAVARAARDGARRAACESGAAARGRAPPRGRGWPRGMLRAGTGAGSARRSVRDRARPRCGPARPASGRLRAGASRFGCGQGAAGGAVLLLVDAVGDSRRAGLAALPGADTGVAGTGRAATRAASSHGGPGAPAVATGTVGPVRQPGGPAGVAQPRRDAAGVAWTSPAGTRVGVAPRARCWRGALEQRRRRAGAGSVGPGRSDARRVRWPVTARPPTGRGAGGTGSGRGSPARSSRRRAREVDVGGQPAGGRSPPRPGEAHRVERLRPAVAASSQVRSSLMSPAGSSLVEGRLDRRRRAAGSSRARTALAAARRAEPTHRSSSEEPAHRLRVAVGGRRAGRATVGGRADTTYPSCSTVTLTAARRPAGDACAESRATSSAAAARRALGHASSAAPAEQ